MKSVSWRIKHTSTTTKDYFPSFLFNVSLQTDCQEQLKLFNEFKKDTFSHIIYKIGTGVSLRTWRLEEEFAHVMMCTFLHSTDLFSPYDKTTRVVIILGFWSSLVLLCRMTTPNSSLIQFSRIDLLVIHLINHVSDPSCSWRRPVILFRLWSIALFKKSSQEESESTVKWEFLKKKKESMTIKSLKHF